MDDRALLERLARQIQEPHDVMDGLLRRRDRKRRNARVRAGVVGLFVFAAVVALAIGAIDRTTPAPPIAPPDPDVVTFTFGTGPAALYVNAHRVEGDMINAPPTSGVFYRSNPPRTVDVPAGARIVVQTTGIDDVDGWVDACCDLSEPPLRLYQLDLAGTALVPSEPGRYFIEFSVWWPYSEGGLITFLFPVRVVAP